MSDRADGEFRTLREAITHRTHVRSGLALAGLIGWAAALLATLIALPFPVASVVPLLVLVATFEVIRPLHAGAERIGRYVQVFVEEVENPDGGLRPPAWERTAMQLGPTLPGAAGHPVFAPVFALAAIANLLAVLLPDPVPVELALLAVPHVSFVLWVWRADGALRRQRAADLERYRAMRDQSRQPLSAPPRAASHAVAPDRA